MKIAHNVLNLNELPSNHKEEILLDWFSKIGPKNHSLEVWTTLYSCLNSTSLQNCRQNDIKQSTLYDLIKVSNFIYIIYVILFLL